MVFCIDSVLKRKRRDSVTTRKPHQYWCVYDWRLQKRETKQSSAHAHIASKKNHPSDCGHQDFEKEARASFRPPEIYRKQRGTNKMKEDPHPFKGSNCSKIQRIQTSQLKSKELVAHVHSSHQVCVRGKRVPSKMLETPTPCERLFAKPHVDKSPLIWAPLHIM